MKALSKADIVYPDSDGKPLADNTLEFHWIALLQGNIDALLPDFVAADLLWYPVEGDNKTRAAPDTLVALGRPKGERGSYRQWEEGGVAPQVAFEVLSPGNTPQEMEDKLAFYETYGVREYYVIDPDLDAPDQAILEVYLRRQERLQLTDFGTSHKSALLGISFVRKEGRLTLYHPDGRLFQPMPALMAELIGLATERDALALQRDAVTVERDAVVAQREAVTVERDVLAGRLTAATTERDAVAAERDAATTERDAVAAENVRLVAQLRALGIDPDER